MALAVLGPGPSVAEQVAVEPAVPDVEAWRVERLHGAAGTSVPFGAVPPNGVRFDERGRVYVVDTQAARVFVLEPDLTPRSSLGRRGRGPGEFTRPTLLAAGRGRVVVFDPGASRITTFEGDRPGWSVAWSIIERGVPQRLDLLDGEVVVEAKPLEIARVGEGERTPAPGLFGLRPDGSLRRLVVFDEPNAPERRRSAAPVVFAPAMHWEVSDTGELLFSRTDRYIVEAMDRPPGPRRLRARRPGLEAAPVGPEMRERVREVALRRYLENRRQSALAEVDEAAMRGSVNAMEFAERLPLTGSVLALGAGSLLVQRGLGLVDGSAPGAPPSGLVSASWDVFDRSGAYVGIATFPDGFVPADAHGDRVVGVREGSLGEVMVEVFRVSR